MNTKEEQLAELQRQAEQLKSELKLESQSKILPFIRRGKATCNFDGNYTGLHITLAPEDEKELISYITANQDNGWHRFGCPISDVADIRYEDGRFHIYFDFSGKSTDRRDKFIAGVKALNINVDFTRYKEKINFDLKQVQQTLADVILIEERLAQV